MANALTDLIWEVHKEFSAGDELGIDFQEKAFYDILKEQSNLSRSISASMRQDTEYNAINSYFMVHFVYRLNAFGKGNSRGGFDGPRPGGRGGRGGFGGGRPF